MKKYLIILFLGFFCTLAFGQPADSIPDLNNSNWKKRHNTIKLRFFLLDVGINTLLHDGSLTLPSTPFMNSDYNISDLELDYSRSINVNVHIFSQRIGLVRNRLNVVHGLYFNVENYRFENDIRLIPGQQQLLVVTDSINYKKNRLTTTFLTMPLMLNVLSDPGKPYRSFRMSAGVYGGILLFSRTRQKSDAYGKQVVKDDFNLNKVRFGFRGEFGFGPLNFYVTYSPFTSVFRENEGPELLPLNFGFILVPF